MIDFYSVSAYTNSVKNILIVGKTFDGFEKYLQNNNFNAVFLRDENNDQISFFDIFDTDFSSDEDFLQIAQKINSLIKIDGVFTMYENYIVPAAKIAARLHLPYLPIAAAQNCTDKFLMRTAFSRSPEKISPDFAIVRNEKDIKEFAKNHKFPLIMKPTNLSKSLLVYKNDNAEELLKNFARITELAPKIYQKYAPSSAPKILVEEFLDGSIHSVDAFIDHSGNPQILQNVVDYQTGYDIGYDDNFHYSRILPSKLSAEKIAEIRHCAEVGARSLGMENSPAHIEIILTNDGPRIVEIGARNGGYRDRMYLLANGIDIYGNWIKTILGERVDILAQKNEDCAVLELFPRENGIFVGIKNEEKLRKLPSLNDFHFSLKIGDLIGKAGDGYKRSAVVILHNSDSAQFKKDLDFVRNNVSIITK
jgi:hypothetical protein